MSFKNIKLTLRLWLMQLNFTVYKNVVDPNNFKLHQITPYSQWFVDMTFRWKRHIQKKGNSESMQRNLSFQIMEACCFPTLRPAIRRSFINPVRKKTLRGLKTFRDMHMSCLEDEGWGKLRPRSGCWCCTRWEMTSQNDRFVFQEPAKDAPVSPPFSVSHIDSPTTDCYGDFKVNSLVPGPSSSSSGPFHPAVP